MHKREEFDAHRYDFLVETLHMIHTIKAFAAEKIFQRRYESLKEDVGNVNHRVAKHYSFMSNIGSLFSSLMMVCSVFVGATLVLQQHMTMGALIATILLTGRIMQPVQKGMSIWTKRQHFDMAKEEIEELFTTPLLKTAATVTADYHGVVHVDEIKFRYHPKQPWVLDGVSLSLNAGEAVAISATHGSGKTTLLHLLAGMYPPTQGMILIDGQPVTSFDQQDIVTHVGLLETQGVIFRGTIRDNITRFGLTPEQDAQSVSRLLGINEDVAKLPAGFNTILDGVDSDSLPPGFKQKIAIARALAPHPKVVLYDEAERDLDIFGYHLLYRLLAKMKGHVTLILMTDDQNLHSLADKRYHLDKGVLTPLPTLIKEASA
jgi:ATP-binding cassette subfamily C protein LapB